MARRLFLTYVALILGPLALAAAAFALRDRLARRRQARWDGDGRDESERLEHTVEEMRAP